MKRRIVRALVRGLLPTMTVLASNVAQARMDPAAVEIAAMGIAAYEANKDKCVFEDVIHAKFPELDAYFRNEAPYAWDRAKRKATMEISSVISSGMLGTDATKSGPDVDCMNAAKLMHLGMVPAMFFVMMDPTFGAAVQRLGDSRAKARDASQALPRNRNPVAPPEKSTDKDTRLSKYVVETAFACLRLGISANKDSGDLFPDCLKHTSEQVEPLDDKMKFRLAFLVYRTLHTWGSEKGALVKAPSPFEEEKRCSRHIRPANCMTKVATDAFVTLLETISDVGDQNDLQSFRDALVESGG